LDCQYDQPIPSSAVVVVAPDGRVLCGRAGDWNSLEDEMIIKNAVIESATISKDDHGLLSAWLMLSYGGSGQGFGGYTLYLPKGFAHSANQKNYAGHFIWRCMEVAEVSEWGQLKGRCIRVKLEAEYSSPIKAIGHIIKEDWFDPSADFKQLEGGTA
jgi:hypothetical protein